MKTLSKKNLKKLADRLWRRKWIATSIGGGEELREKGFLDKEADTCGMCGKALSTETHRRLGIGPECINQNLLRIGILTNRWMDFMTGCEFGESRPIQGDPLMNFETHEEAISDEVGSEMRDFLNKLELDDDLDGILVRPAETWEEPELVDPTGRPTVYDAIPRWRCWMLFRNPQPPYEWRDALSEGEVEADWRRRYMVDGIWQSHDFQELDTFSTIGLASMDDKDARTSLEPPPEWWTKYLDHVQEMISNTWRYHEDDRFENFAQMMGLQDAPYDMHDFACTLYYELKKSCECQHHPTHRVCEWCIEDDIISWITRYNGGLHRYRSEELAQKPDYDKLGLLLEDYLKDENEDQYGHNPANLWSLRESPVRSLVFATSAQGVED